MKATPKKERELFKMALNVVTMGVFSTLLLPVLPDWDTLEIREERQSPRLPNGLINDAQHHTSLTKQREHHLNKKKGTELTEPFGNQTSCLRNHAASRSHNVPGGQEAAEVLLGEFDPTVNPFSLAVHPVGNTAVRIAPRM